eukprot:12355.XXX_20417_20551_1 [CDS] Oithona nana genome sequencing.
MHFVPFWKHFVAYAWRTDSVLTHFDPRISVVALFDSQQFLMLLL